MRTTLLERFETPLPTTTTTKYKTNSRHWNSKTQTTNVWTHTYPLCGLIHLKKLLENNFQGPIFIRGSPSTTQTTTVWTHTTTVLVIWPQITTGKQLSGPLIYKWFSLHNTKQQCVDILTTVWVNWPQITTGKQLWEPHVYQGFSVQNRNNHYVRTHNHCLG